MSFSNQYTERIAGAMTHKPKFEWFVYQLTEPFRENSELLSKMHHFFDLDTAQGAQLDAVGVRIGASRTIIPPIDAVTFFSLDVKGAGLDEANWHRPYVDNTSLIKTLDDDSFRFLLRCKVRTNQQDGSIEGLHALIAELKERYGITLKIEDGFDMTAKFIVDEENVPIVIKKLLTGGYLNIKPAGIRTTWETEDGNK